MRLSACLARPSPTDSPADLWLPLQADPNSTSQAHNLIVVARLNPGVTLAKAQAAMKLATEEFRRKFPVTGLMGPNESSTAIPLRDVVVGDVRPAMLVLLGAVGFVLLIACANMASLLHGARNPSQARDRRSSGARRGTAAHRLAVTYREHSLVAWRRRAGSCFWLFRSARSPRHKPREYPANRGAWLGWLLWIGGS